MLEKIQYDQRYASLLVVYRFGSYTLAASELALTPSAVSQQIHSVERELAVPLFVRQKNRLVPTDTCHLVVESVKKIQAVCRQMSEGIDCSHRHIERLSVGITPSAEKYALSAVLPSLEGILIKADTGTSDTLIQKLRNREIDLALIEGNCDTCELGSVILDTDYLTVAVSPDSVWGKKGMILPEELLKEKLILKPKQSGTRRLLESGLRSMGMEPEKLHVIMEVDNIDTILRLVSMKYGLSVLSNKACRDYMEHAHGNIVVIPLEGLHMSRSIRMVYRPGEATEELIHTIQQNYNRPKNRQTVCNLIEQGEEGSEEK